jgi:hypothetical protein
LLVLTLSFPIAASSFLTKELGASAILFSSAAAMKYPPSSGTISWLGIVYDVFEYYFEIDEITLF